MVHTESLDTCTYVHTYIGIHNIHTYKAHHVRINVQLNLLNAKFYGQFHNSMLKAFHVDSTHIMHVHISWKCRDLTIILCWKDVLIRFDYTYKLYNTLHTYIHTYVGTGTHLLQHIQVDQTEQPDVMVYFHPTQH